MYKADKTSTNFCNEKHNRINSINENRTYYE